VNELKPPPDSVVVRHRDLTAEARESPEDDQHASAYNKSEQGGDRSEGGSEHHTSQGDKKRCASLSGSESGKRSERQRTGPQAPIVWQPVAPRPKSLFDHHQKLLDAAHPTHEQQDFGVPRQLLDLD
jgi:hypothetical protein